MNWLSCRKICRYSIAVATIFLLVLTPLASAETIHVLPDPAAPDALQEVLILAKPGDVIQLAEGQFDLVDGLSLDVDDVKIIGAGADKTILQFANQRGAGEGLLITSSKVVLEDFAVENTKGDGIKSKGSDQITFRNVRVEWVGGAKTTNGAYGIYPVESKNVLIENCFVSGASDAGIYVGQSQNIIVRNNRAEYNVAGIEIENSYFADVYGNVATHNTGGILVFDLPNLKQMGGHSIRVFDNMIVDNDTENFAPKGNIVGVVPKGTGMLIMANRNVHIYGNTFKNHAMTHVAIVSYIEDFDDDTYFPHPRAIYVHDNTYEKGGFAPSGEVGKVFAEVAGSPVPDIIWDGVMPLTEWITWMAEGEGIFIKEAKATRFANLRMITNTIIPWGVSPDRDKSGYAGNVKQPEPVQLPQLPQN